MVAQACVVRETDEVLLQTPKVEQPTNANRKESRVKLTPRK